MNAPQPRDRAGRFGGAERFDVERLPLIPATTVGVLLRDPLRTLVLIWADPAVRVAEYVVTLEVVPGVRDLIRLTALGAQPGSVRVIRQRVPGDGQRLMWLCPACARRTRHLFIGLRPDTSALIVGCRVCLHLRHMSQGGAQIRKTLTRMLAGIEDGVPLPRGLCVPTVITGDRKYLRRFRNLVVEDAQDGVPAGIVG